MVMLLFVVYKRQQLLGGHVFASNNNKQVPMRRCRACQSVSIKTGHSFQESRNTMALLDMSG